MQRIMMINDEGQWFATGINAATDLLDHWSDDAADAIEFKSARAQELVYSYNRKYRGTGAKAGRFDVERKAREFDQIATIIQGIGS